MSPLTFRAGRTLTGLLSRVRLLVPSKHQTASKVRSSLSTRGAQLQDVASQQLQFIKAPLPPGVRLPFTNNTNGLGWRVCRIVLSMHLSLNLL